jgi:site-specific DNA recombinase
VLYLREDAIAGPIDRFLHEELGHRNLAANLRKLAAAQHRSVTDDEARGASEEHLRQTLAECDTKLAQYRAALDAGGDAAVVGWIKETTAIRAATRAMLGAQPTRPQRMTDQQIAKIVEGLGGLLGLLHNADPTDRAEIYARVGLHMTYRPGTETVIAEVISPAIDGVLDMCPRGGLEPQLHDQNDH